LDVELARPDVWQDAGRAAQCSRERGTLAGRVTAVDDMENELLEHVGLAELAHEENDTQVAFVCDNSSHIQTSAFRKIYDFCMSSLSSYSWHCEHSPTSLAK
jgi:hypothetical protein